MFLTVLPYSVGQSLPVGRLLLPGFPVPCLQLPVSWVQNRMGPPPLLYSVPYIHSLQISSFR